MSLILKGLQSLEASRCHRLLTVLHILKSTYKPTGLPREALAEFRGKGGAVYKHVVARLNS